MEREITEEVSILGYYPKEKKIPTHYERKFRTKRAKWEWMEKNFPDACDLCWLVKETFGEITEVKIWSLKHGAGTN